MLVQYGRLLFRLIISERISDENSLTMSLNV